ncbi:MAG: hypothetical protein ABFE08_09215 [Armatimonadia bacterium]
MATAALVISIFSAGFALLSWLATSKQARHSAEQVEEMREQNRLVKQQIDLEETAQSVHQANTLRATLQTHATLRDYLRHKSQIPDFEWPAYRSTAKQAGITDATIAQMCAAIDDALARPTFDRDKVEQEVNTFLSGSEDALKEVLRTADSQHYKSLRKHLGVAGGMTLY